jgi:hypothetical protein
MDMTLFLLVYVTLFLPVIIVFSYLFIKALQAPVDTRGRVKNLSTREHRELFEAAFIAPMRIKPFPPDTQHEQETLQQPKELDSDRASGN